MSKRCLRCGHVPDNARLREVCGMLLCPGCSMEIRGEISARADALATERAHKLAAAWSARVPLVDRDPIERVLRAAHLAAREVGVFEVARAILTPDLPGRIRQNLATALVGLQVTIESGPAPGRERAHEAAVELNTFAVGRAAGHDLAARALSRALELLADPACDLRGVLVELRGAVERVRECETIRLATEHLLRQEEPRRRAPRRRIVKLTHRDRERAA